MIHWAYVECKIYKYKICFECVVMCIIPTYCMVLIELKFVVLYFILLKCFFFSRFLHCRNEKSSFIQGHFFNKRAMPSYFNSIYLSFYLIICLKNLNFLFFLSFHVLLYLVYCIILYVCNYFNYFVSRIIIRTDFIGKPIHVMFFLFLSFDLFSHFLFCLTLKWIFFIYIF